VEKLLAGDGLSIVNVGDGMMLASVGTEAQGKPTYGDLYRLRRLENSWAIEKLRDKYAHHMTVDRFGTTLFPCPSGWCELSRSEVVGWKGPDLRPRILEHAGSSLLENVLRDRFDCLWFRSEATASYQCPGMAAAEQMPDTMIRYDSSAHLEEGPDGNVLLLVSLTYGRPDNFHTARVRNGMPTGMDSALVARDGTIWIGTESGLFRFMYPFRLEYWNQDNGIESAYSIVRIGDSVFGTSSGVSVLRDDRRFWNSLGSTEKLNGVAGLMAGPGDTLFASSADGVAQVRKDGTILARSPLMHGIVAIRRNREGQMWVGRSLGENGLFRMKIDGNRLTLQPENLPLAASPDAQYDEIGRRLWACNGKNLVYLEGAHWHTFSTKQGLLDFDCRTIALQSNGDVWLGYNAAAYTLIKNPTSERPLITNYSADLNTFVANNSVEFLNFDHRGRLWRGSSVDYVATAEAAEAGNWIRLDAIDGFPSPGGNTHAFYSDADGSIWVGSDATVTHFSPSDDFTNSFPAPQVFVSGFSMPSGELVLAGNGKGIRYGSNLVAHIGSLQFDRRNALAFRYRLVPENGWKSTSSFDVALGKLGWGQHTLEVQARLGTGEWSQTSSTGFMVLKPFWLTWPVVLGVVIFGGLIVFGIREWKKRRERRAEKALPELAEWRLAALSPELQGLQGTLLDERFEVGRILARGGFALVATGRDLHHNGRPCALKIFRQELVDKEWIAKRFQQEVFALQQVHHPNVVSIYGHGTTASGAPYLAMEFIEGETLREILDQRTLTRAEIASFLLQIGSALSEIHGYGICHRDLKPENLMIRIPGVPGKDVVLIDFSIAIVKDPDETLYGLSRAAGTLYYMAPEQAIGYADASSDIYSLAKILIEMLTRQRLSGLFPDASIDLPMRVREFLSQPDFMFSNASINLMSQALEFDPLRRPQDAKEFSTVIARDLESAIEPISTEEAC
jgi:hypothetical protein